MEPSQQRACGKMILLGEHFVVHGSPALALPFTSVRTLVSVTPAARNQLTTDASEEVARSARKVLDCALETLFLSDCRFEVTVESTVPLGHGLGSSAAFSVALLRALNESTDLGLNGEEINTAALELERISHGNPSGIDNTTICYEQPLWFKRPLGGSETSPVVEFLPCPGSLHFLLASSGKPGSTREAVANVGQLKQAEPERFEQLTQQATRLALRGRTAFEAGEPAALGQVMRQNHGLLQQIGVSTEQLDRLVETALSAGALGAKLTGSGCGGFVAALVTEETQEAVTEALQQAGAPQLIPLGPV